jgi:hypothetical protein
MPMETVKRRASPNLEDAEEAIYANGWFLSWVWEMNVDLIFLCAVRIKYTALF